MIIRPAAGTGNKVIVQDQAGAAVLTTADSGATVADGIALGTPASGVVTNLTGTLGSNITFPAGHVIQTKVKTINLIDNDSNFFSTTSAAGTVINVNSQNLEVTGFSMAAGNLLKVDFSCGMVDGGTGSANGMWGVKVDTQVHMTNFKQAQDFQTVTTNWAKVISGGLSNKTISAVMASSTSNSVRIYCHEYTSNSDSIWSITVQEIQM